MILKIIQYLLIAVRREFCIYLLLWEPKTLLPLGQLGSRAIGNGLEVVSQEVEVSLKVEVFAA